MYGSSRTGMSSGPCVTLLYENLSLCASLRLWQTTVKVYKKYVMTRVLPITSYWDSVSCCVQYFTTPVRPRIFHPVTWVIEFTRLVMLLLLNIQGVNFVIPLHN